jgi:outer membrane protein
VRRAAVRTKPAIKILRRSTFDLPFGGCPLIPNFTTGELSKIAVRAWALCLLGTSLCLAADGSDRSASQVTAASSLPAPSALHDYVKDGKLSLSLEDAIRLTLLNNTDVRLARTPVDQAGYGLLASYRAFDPLMTVSGSDQRSISSADNLLQGVGLGVQTNQSLNQLTQQASLSYTQTFAPGTNVNVSFSGSKGDTNSTFFFINPYLTANLSIQVTQPLLRNRGLFPNLAPIRIARRNLNASQDSFQAQASTLVQQGIDQYWIAVQAREGLRVAQESLKEAQASYDHDKRSLDLGALPPLDIYRSESQVAQRRVAEIQAEYAWKQAEDQLRQVIGADLDPYIRTLDLDLTQEPASSEPLFSIDEATALTEARTHRPEFKALDEQLAADDISVRLAQNQLLPDLELQGSYLSSGIGGNQYNTATPPVLIAPGGFGSALSQLFGFGYPTYTATLTLNLPIRNRAGRAALGQARVTRTNDLYQVRRQNQTVELEVANAVHSLEQAKLSIAAARIARDLAQKTVESEQRKVQLGTGTTFFVLEAQNELTQAENTLVQAEISYQTALAAIDHATGTLLDRHHIQLDQTVGKRL